MKRQVASVSKCILKPPASLLALSSFLLSPVGLSLLVLYSPSPITALHWLVARGVAKVALSAPGPVDVGTPNGQRGATPKGD